MNIDKSRYIRQAKNALQFTLGAVGVVVVVVGISAVVQHFMYKDVVDDVIQGAVDAAGGV